MSAWEAFAKIVIAAGSWLAGLIQAKWGDLIGIMLILVSLHYAIHFNSNETIKDLCEKVMAAGLVITRPSSWTQPANGNPPGNSPPSKPPMPAIAAGLLLVIGVGMFLWR